MAVETYWSAILVSEQEKDIVASYLYSMVSDTRKLTSQSIQTSGSVERVNAMLLPRRGQRCLVLSSRFQVSLWPRS